MDQLQIAIPKDVENLQLPDPTLITYYKNLENRVLWLDSDVDEYWLEFARKIIEWNREDKGILCEKRKPIMLMFFTRGGDLDVNNAIVDLIKSSKTPVWGVNIGQADSAGCNIFISCHVRLALPNSTFLIHHGSGEFGGTYEQVLAALMEYQRKIADMEQFLLDNTKIPKNILEENISTEWFLSAQEALKYGVCDKIIDSIDEIL